MLLPRLWDLDLVAGRIAPPFDATREIGTITFDANDLLGLVVTPIVLVAVTAFLRRSAAGTAIRASADSADRAALLGVPVARLQTLVWSVAGALAFTAVFLRSGILDVPTTTALGFGVLLRALVALVLGRLTDLPGVASAAVALGVLELGIGWDHDISLIDPVLGLVVIAALVWRRREVGRVDLADAAAWRAADEVRPVPAALAALGGARAARWGLIAIAGVVALALPAVLSADQEFKAAAVLDLRRAGPVPGAAGRVGRHRVARAGGLLRHRRRRDRLRGLRVGGRPVRRADHRHGRGVGGGRARGDTGPPAPRPLPGGDHVRVRAGHHVLPARRRPVRLGARRPHRARPVAGRVRGLVRGRDLLPRPRGVRVGRPGPARRADQPLRPRPRGGARQRAGRRVVRRRPDPPPPGGLQPVGRDRRPGRWAVRPSRACLRPVVVLGRREPRRAHDGRDRGDDLRRRRAARRPGAAGLPLVPRPRVAVPRLGARRASDPAAGARRPRRPGLPGP